MSQPKSLWLNPSRKPVKVDLSERFNSYPYFVYSFAQYVTLKIPKVVEVTWKPLKPLLQLIEACNEDEATQHAQWIDYVSGIMKEGHDVPPVLLQDGALFDGRHRSWAAHNIGLRRAPTVEIGSYWES